MMFFKHSPRAWPALALLLFACLSPAQDTAPAAAQEEDTAAFHAWLAQLRAEALSQGISAQTVELAFSDITPPVRRVIENDRNQPEAVQTYDDYISQRVSEWRMRNGRQRLVEHAALLADVADQYGVQARFIAAIWGMETNYGTYPVSENIFNVLATLAYDPRRASMFRAQFLAALRILDSGFPAYGQLKSSWAGAMGQSQFSAESYLDYAVDHDGDGRRDIWNSQADVFASIANYLKARGWRDDITWGRPVRLPPGEEAALAALASDGPPDRHCASHTRRMGPWRDLQDWQARGVRRADGGDLPARSLPAALVVGDGDDAKGWLVYRNFCSILGYNASTKYALSIGLLSDRISED